RVRCVAGGSRVARLGHAARLVRLRRPAQRDLFAAGGGAGPGGALRGGVPALPAARPALDSAPQAVARPGRAYPLSARGASPPARSLAVSLAVGADVACRRARTMRCPACRVFARFLDRCPRALPAARWALRSRGQWPRCALLAAAPGVASRHVRQNPTFGLDL